MSHLSLAQSVAAAHLSAERVGVASRIQSADGDRSGRGLRKAKKRPHERGFPAPLGPIYVGQFKDGK